MATIGEMIGQAIEPGDAQGNTPLEDRPIIYAEGRIVEVNLNKWLLPSTVSIEKEEGPVVAMYIGHNGKYIKLFDYRQESIEAMKLFGSREWLEHFFAQQVPCLGTMRQRKSQYIVLVDIGDPNTDIVDGGELFILFAPKMDHRIFKVLESDGLQAIHPATKICFAEGRI